MSLNNNKIFSQSLGRRSGNKKWRQQWGFKASDSWAATLLGFDAQQNMFLRDKSPFSSFVAVSIWQEFFWDCVYVWNGSSSGRERKFFVNFQRQWILWSLTHFSRVIYTDAMKGTGFSWDRLLVLIACSCGLWVKKVSVSVVDITHAFVSLFFIEREFQSVVFSAELRGGAESNIPGQCPKEDPFSIQWRRVPLHRGKSRSII